MRWKRNHARTAEPIFLKVVPSLVPNVVGGTLNVVTHALPELPQEKKEEEKKRRKRGESAFFLWTSWAVHG